MCAFVEASTTLWSSMVTVASRSAVRSWSAVFDVYTVETRAVSSNGWLGVKEEALRLDLAVQ